VPKNAAEFLRLNSPTPSNPALYSKAPEGFQPNRLFPTRQSLLSRLRDWDDQQSWQQFFDNYWRLIYGAAIKTGLSDAEAQDVVQETILTVAKKMPDFKYDPAIGSFRSWLLLITRRRIADYLQAQSRERGCARGEAPEPLSDLSADEVITPSSQQFDELWDSEWEKNLVAAAIERVKTQVSPRQFQIFDCHVLQRWPAREVIQTLKVNLGQVYLAKHRVGSLLKKEIKRLEKEFN
jgi:RNA polymerase sigma factor (sigma-70 family)